MKDLASDHATQHVTDLLQDVSAGLPQAQETLFACVYTELHRMAYSAWRWVPQSDTLQPTALVHEMYVRLFHQKELAWENRRHFFATASRAMHDILVEQARRHGSLKRGGHLRRVPLTGDESINLATQSCEVLALEDTLERLRAQYPEVAHIVMLRMFGGLSYSEIAEVEGCAAITVRRRWSFAKAWIKEHIFSDDF